MMTEKQKPITENSMKKLFANFTAQFKEEMISLLDELVSKKVENLWQEKLQEIKVQELEIEEIQKSRTFISDEMDELKKKLNHAMTTLKEKDQQIEDMKKTIDCYQKKQGEIENNLEQLEQYGRRENLEFLGIPQMTNENTNEIIKKLVKKLNIEICKKDIAIAHRIKKRTYGNDDKIQHAPIIIRFANRDIRNKIYSKRTCINQISDYEIPGMERLFINENLTGYRKMLFSKAKKLQKEHGYKFLWTNQCQILIRKNPYTDVLKINHYEDLSRIC